MTTYSDVRPGDRLIFERPGGVIYGGAVWQSPTTGDIIAGDTFLTLNGEWLDDPTGEVRMTLDTSRRRAGETWKVAKIVAPVESYTPTTEDVRRAYGAWSDTSDTFSYAAFDRWFLQECEAAEYSGYLRAVREGLHR